MWRRLVPLMLVAGLMATGCVVAEPFILGERPGGEPCPDSENHWSVPVKMGTEDQFPEPECMTTNAEQGTSYLHYAGFEIAAPLLFATDEQMENGDVFVDSELQGLGTLSNGNHNGDHDVDTVIGTWQCLQFGGPVLLENGPNGHLPIGGAILTTWKDTGFFGEGLLEMAGFTMVHPGNWGNPHLPEDVQLMARSEYLPEAICEVLFEDANGDGEGNEDGDLIVLNNG